MTKETRPEERGTELLDEELEAASGGAAGVGGGLPIASQSFGAADRPAAPTRKRTGG